MWVCLCVLLALPLSVCVYSVVMNFMAYLKKSGTNWSVPLKRKLTQKSMNVSDMKVTDKDDFLSRSMMIKAKNIIMKERIWINRVISKIESQSLESDTDARLHKERIIAVKRNPVCT